MAPEYREAINEARKSPAQPPAASIYKSILSLIAEHRIRDHDEYRKRRANTRQQRSPEFKARKRADSCVLTHLLPVGQC